MSIEARLLRDRVAGLGQQLDLAAPGIPDGAMSMVVQTVQVSEYPTDAQAYYCGNPVQIAGDESEGATATTTVDSQTVVVFWNAGTAVPPQGTLMLIHNVGGRAVGRYDG